MNGPRRAQSEVVGVVLLLGLTIVVTGATVAIGSDAIDSTQQQVESTNAENVLSHVDAKASLVALGSAESQSIDLPRTDADRYAVNPDAGWVRVRYVNGTGDENLNETMPLGAVTYTNDDAEIAYQGGGVWRSQGNGTMMITPPEIHYEDGTLTLPIISMNGSANGGGSTMTLTQTGASTVVYPNASRDWTNPLTEGTVYVTIQSDYYRAWARYFESRTRTDIDVDDSRQQVTMRLVESTNNPTVGGAIVSTAGDHLRIQSGAIVDSYNSSVGNYSETAAENTSVITAGSVKVQGSGTRVKGDLVAGGDVTVQSGAQITGDLSYGGDLTLRGSDPVGGTVSGDVSIPSLSSADGMINAKRDTLRNDSVNDNDAADDIDASTDSLRDGQTSWELDAGRYYLSDLVLKQDEQLTLDTTDGNIELVVDGRLKLKGDSDVTVEGEGRVNVYTNGPLRVQSDARMVVPDQNAPQLWVYMKSHEQAKIQGHGVFVGVIYGPSSGPNPGVSVRVQSTADVYGGIVGYVDHTQGSGNIHYDEALRGENVFDTEYVATINYLHVTNQTVNVST
ncbi:polymer-forming cytoskeletal protein [Halarchaeum nitratireducens]|nr:MULTISPECIES: polymer-forming cytoskeletal protein [Halarchaeum]MBP2252146.1 flagellin-like protein [Halarchaeum solikamskense]